MKILESIVAPVGDIKETSGSLCDCPDVSGHHSKPSILDLPEET